MAIITITPLPWNLTLVIMDALIWLTKLAIYQTFYAFKIVLWWMDVSYQFSVMLITDYDKTAAYLRW